MSRDPWLKFYPADWLVDIKLQTCGLAAQGLLINLMCIMHQSDKYGYLLINGTKPEPSSIQRLTRISQDEYQSYLSELLANGVLKEDPYGVIYCPRMVRDWELRQAKRRVGSMGGNPSLVNQEVNHQVNQVVNQQVNQETQQVHDKLVNPRSQKSEVRIRKRKQTDNVFSLPEWIPQKTWTEFLAHRKKQRAEVAPESYPTIVGKFENLRAQGWPPEKAVDIMVEKGWRWFHPNWVAQDPGIPKPRAPDMHLEEMRNLANDPEYMPIEGAFSDLIKNIGKEPK